MNELFSWLTLIVGIITVIGGIVTYSFPVYKYVNTKKIEVKNKRFDQFHRVFDWVTGRPADGDGRVLTDVHQAMAIYELSEFPEYKYLILPIIDFYLKKSENDPDDSVFRKSLLYSKEKLSR